MKINYSEWLPCSALRDIVRNYWLFEIPERYNDGQSFEFELMPENYISMVFVRLQDTHLVTYSGIRTHSMIKEIHPGTTLLGIRFNPWISIPELFSNKQDTMNQVVVCDEPMQFLCRDMLAAFGNNFNENVAVIEQTLLQFQQRFSVEMNEIIKYICLKLDDPDHKIQDIVKDIPMAIRPIQKQFKQITGLSMIEYRNIGRLRETAKSIFFHNNSISYSAMVGGFTDHAHFIHSFQKYMKSKSFKLYYQKNHVVAFKK